MRRIILYSVLVFSIVLNIVFLSGETVNEFGKYLKINRIRNKAARILEPHRHQKLFRVPENIVHRVEFWQAVYSRYDSNMSVIHDSRNLSIIYEVLDFNYMVRKNYSPLKKELARKRLTLKSRAKIIQALLKIATISRQGKSVFRRLNSYERKIFRKVRQAKGYSFREAARRVREQRGQKDMVVLALKRSPGYMSSMKKILIREGLPEELFYLTFVESSFNIEAESAAGAVGVWQIMTPVGKRFLTVDRRMDERKDPIKATEVAAIILKESHRKLKSWPLVITSYNVGWPNLLSELRKIKGSTLEDVIDRSRSRRIGFAVKNFYASFIAMLNVCSNTEKFFPGVIKNKKVLYKTMILKHDARLRDILFGAKVTFEEFRVLNPEFKKAVLLSRAKILRGTRIKLPGRARNRQL